MNKGVALLWSLILIIVLMITSGVMVNYIIKESQSSVRIEESTRAYSAAQSGVDWGKDYVKKNKSLPVETKTLTIDLEQKVKAEVSFRGNLSSYTITSVGIVGNKVKRAIEQQSSDFNFTSVAFSNPPQLTTLPSSNTGSFSLLFDFWLENATTEWNFGISSTQSTTIFEPDSYIWLTNRGSRLVLITKAPNEVPTETLLEDVTDMSTLIGQGNMRRVEIKYIDGIAASLKFYGHFADEGTCSVSTNVALPDMGDLKYLAAPGMNYDSSPRNGGAIQPTNAAYFQNLFFKSN